VCFRCGDAHRRADCRWTGRCSRCGKEDHKEVVCRQNPNSKVRWEQVSSTFSQRGSAHMMANSSQAQQLPMQQFLPATPTHQFLPAPPMQQFLPAPSLTSMGGNSLVPSSGGAYWLPRAPTPSAPSA